MCSPSPPPAQPTNTTQTTIPEYMRPTAERTIGKAEALADSPYVNYGGQRLAQLTPEQQQINQNILGRQLPGQIGTGSDIATVGGLNALQAGNQATMTGQNLYSQLTSPDAIQSFMSPYMQNVVDVQKAEAIRDAQKGQLAQNLAAPRQGTYGGARQLLAGTERERNLGNQLERIQAGGLQSAYDQAIKNIMGVSQAGLEGQKVGIAGSQAGTQAGATLGQLGTAEGQQFENLSKLQASAAATDQAMRQKELDLAYQDFITQQQDPYKKLGFLSDILRGSANLTATGGKTVYEQQPSPLNQLVGPGLLGLGLYREFNKS